jgi:hypothetical protein
MKRNFQLLGVGQHEHPSPESHTPMQIAPYPVIPGLRFYCLRLGGLKPSPLGEGFQRVRAG